MVKLKEPYLNENNNLIDNSLFTQQYFLYLLHKQKLWIKDNVYHYRMKLEAPKEEPKFTLFSPDTSLPTEERTQVICVNWWSVNWSISQLVGFTKTIL